MNKGKSDPALLAAGDQAIAETNRILDHLLDVLRDRYQEGDRTYRTVAFAADVDLHSHQLGNQCLACEAWAGLLAVALIRLDEAQRSRP